MGLMLFVALFNTVATAQKGLSVKDKYFVNEANTLFFSNYFDEAIGKYMQIYNRNSDNAFLNYRIGFCHLYLQDYEDAVGFFETVQGGSLKKANYDFYYGYGSALQNLGKYADALEQYEAFKQRGRKKDLDYYEVEKRIQECNYALANMVTPVSVSIENLGDSINSIYNDYHPSVSIDGKRFMFTSRREDSKGGEKLPDGQYYEDIYESTWNSVQQTWGTSKPVEGAVNSKEYDGNSGLSADGNTLFMYRNSSEENKKVLTPTGGGDIMYSKVGSTGRWSAPKFVEGVNSTTLDYGAVVTADGKTMYFISNRTGILQGRGTQGGKDIWKSTLQEDGTWGKPENLGDKINTSGDESSVFIHPNGQTLFFCSEGHNDKSYGGFDVFRSELKNGEWTVPENLGYPINTHKDEKEFVISTDGQVAWLSSNRVKGRKDFDIYQVDLEFYNVLTGESQVLSILKGKVVDASTGLPLATKITVKEKESGKEVSITSNKDGTYFNTFASYKTYIVTINHAGYKPYTKEVKLEAPKQEKPKRRRSSRRRKPQKNTKTHTVELDFLVEREKPIDVVSKDLFKKQVIAFNKTEAGFELNGFSKDLLEMYAQQVKLAPEIKLEINGHFGNDANANEMSKVLADKVAEFLISKGASKGRLVVEYLGSSEPLASNETEIGKAANRRVEIRIIL